MSRLDRGMWGYGWRCGDMDGDGGVELYI